MSTLKTGASPSYGVLSELNTIKKDIEFEISLKKK